MISFLLRLADFARTLVRLWRRDPDFRTLVALECLTKPRYASLERILAMPSGAPPIGAFAFPEASSK